MTDYPPSAPINEVLKPANPHSDLEIVGELRKWATIYRGTYGAQVCTQAADEIERLRTDLAELRDQGCEYCDSSVDDRIAAVEGEPDDFVGQFKNWWLCGQCVNKWSHDIRAVIDESKRLRRAGSEVETALDATRRTLAMVLAKNGGCEWITDRQRRSFSYEYLEEEHDAEDGGLTVRVKGDSFD